MKLSTIVSMTVVCLFFFILSLEKIISGTDELKNSFIEINKISFFFVVLLFTVFVLFGIYKNKKWSLFVFLSLILFMTGSYIMFRLNINNTLFLIDLWVVVCFLGVFGAVLNVLLKMKSSSLFDEDEFTLGN